MSDVKAPAKGLYLRASLILAALTLLFVLTAAAMLLFLPILQTFVVMILRRVG